MIGTFSGVCERVFARSGRILSTKSLLIFQPLLTCYTTSKPSAVQQSASCPALEPPIITAASTLPVRSAACIAGLVLLREKLGSVSRSCRSCEFKSWMRLTTNFFSVSRDQQAVKPGSLADQGFGRIVLYSRRMHRADKCFHEGTMKMLNI
jgi:hypothetical protein